MKMWLRGLLALAALFAGSVHAEDCWNGPTGSTSRLDWLGTVTAPAGGDIRMSFSFNADWENMVFVCDTATRQQLAVKGNYSRDRSDWVSPNKGQPLSYTIAAFHKRISPDAGDAGSHPWIQSEMRKTGTLGHEQFGFNDQGGASFTNALVTVNNEGGAPPAKPTISLSLTPSTVSAGPARYTLSGIYPVMLKWSTANATSCSWSGGTWSGSAALSGDTGFAGTNGQLVAGNYYFVLSCKGPGGISLQTQHLTVTPQVPVVLINVEPGTITSGGTATLYWETIYATSCRASGELGWLGPVNLQGPMAVSPKVAGAHTYKLTCDGADRTSTTQSATLTVTSK